MLKRRRTVLYFKQREEANATVSMCYPQRARRAKRKWSGAEMERSGDGAKRVDLLKVSRVDRLIVRPLNVDRLERRRQSGDLLNCDRLATIVWNRNRSATIS